MASKNTKHETVNMSIIQRDEQIYNDMQAAFSQGDYSLQSPYFVRNPYFAAPLSGQLGIKSEVPVKLTVTVLGKRTPIGDIEKVYDSYKNEYFIPVYGLYPDYDNQVQIKTEDAEGNIQLHTLTVETEALPDDFLTIDVIAPAQRNRLNNDVYYCPRSGSYLHAVDYDGEVRWLINEQYADLEPYLDGGSTLWMLKNGHLLANYIDHYALVDMTQDGRIYKIYDLGLYFHHDVIEDSDGNLLAQIQDDDSGYVFDELIKIDRESGEILKRIDFKDVFDPAARVIQPTEEHDGNLTADWLHENSIDYHTPSNTYITSSRHQNMVFAVDQDTAELRWILGSHYDWGEDYKQYLLTPVDQDGSPLYDLTKEEDIAKADREFWQWAQHSAHLYINRNEAAFIDLFVFDNGCYRSYNEDYQVLPNANWSRAVTYRIDLEKMTVRILWEFGKELGQYYYCGYVSNTQYIAETNTLYINFGGVTIDLNTGYNLGIPGQDAVIPDVDYDNTYIRGYSHNVEVDYETKEILHDSREYIPSVIGPSPTYKAFKASLYTVTE